MGPGVFVPRQRTRLLTEVAIATVGTAARHSTQRSPPVFLEAFAGVAPVAAAVRAADPAVEVHVTDLDEEALRYARMNLADTAGVHPSSVLRGLPDRLGARVSVIAAARDFEPAIALFGGTDGLDVARALIGEAPHWLAPHGAVLLEMHGAHVRVAARVAEQHGFTTSATDSQTVVLELRRAPR